MTDRIRDAVNGWPVIERNGYPYVVSPLMDGVPPVDPEMLSDVVDRMISLGAGEGDLILAPEAMGIMYGTLISQRTGVPFCVVRKRPYGLEGEVHISVDTGYSHSEQYVNGVVKGMRVTIVDDVISTGGTLSELVHALKEAGAIPLKAVVAVDKSRDREAVQRLVGIPVDAVMRIGVVDGKAVVLD